jgi:DNA-directed RNA polymerase specialized sigma24 family protein
MNKKFDKALDQKLNKLAMRCATGCKDSEDTLFAVINPLLKRYAQGKATHLDKEDLHQEFMMVAIKQVQRYPELVQKNPDYHVLALIYGMCDNKLKDLGRAENAQKRATRIQDGDEIENRVFSLDAPQSTDDALSLQFPSEDKSVEDQVSDSLNKDTMKDLVKEFVSCTKGRNATIVPLMYAGFQLGWENEELDMHVANVIFDETGKEPDNQVIRQAKSRALKAFRQAVESNKLQSANKLVRV